MRAFISLLLIAALSACVLGNDADCTENLSCPADAPEVCVLHPELYCFIKYDNLCTWNAIKCKFHLNYKLYAPKFCDLENFECMHSKQRRKG